MKSMEVHIRWGVRRDTPEILEIEEKSFKNPWSEEEFVEIFRERNVIHLVAEIEDKVVGFIVYEMQPEHYDLVSIAVHPSFCRLGIGTALLNKLKGKLKMDRRCKIECIVRETNASGLKFFSDSGFTATGVVRKPFADVDDDGIAFEHSISILDILRNRASKGLRL